jgi:hypothetical protein
MSITRTTSYPPLPADIIIQIFSETQSISEIGKIGQVCKAWHKLHFNDRIWKPFLRDLSPHHFESPCKDHQNFTSIKIVVQSFFQGHRETVDEIVNLIDKDTTLARILGDDSMTLEKIKAKSAPDRSLIIWRALGRNAAPLYNYLADKSMNVFVENIYERISKGLDRQTQAETDEFMRQKKHLPLLLKLIQERQGPFDGGQIFHSLACLVMVCPFIQDIFADIVKSHHKMPDFFHSLINVSPPSMPRTDMRVSDFVASFAPFLQDSHGVTMDDWVECGYPL